MQTALRPFALVLLLAACGDDDSPEQNSPDGSTPTGTDASVQQGIDASRPAQPDATTATSDSAVTPIDTDAGNTQPIADDAGQSEDATTQPPQLTPDQMLSAALETKFKSECAGTVFTAGAWSNEFFAVRDGYERCVASCFVNGACADIKSLFCNAQANTVVQCVAACDDKPADGFQCADGSRISHAHVCDLGISKNCPDKSDEANCTDQFTCANNAKIPRKLVCDLIAICQDDSDEKQNCATVACN